jgi:hypothetical protein
VQREALYLNGIVSLIARRYRGLETIIITLPSGDVLTVDTNRFDLSNFLRAEKAQSIIDTLMSQEQYVVTMTDGVHVKGGMIVDFTVKNTGFTTEPGPITPSRVKHQNGSRNLNAMYPLVQAIWESNDSNTIIAAGHVARHTAVIAAYKDNLILSLGDVASTVPQPSRILTGDNTPQPPKVDKRVNSFLVPSLFVRWAMAPCEILGFTTKGNFESLELYTVPQRFLFDGVPVSETVFNAYLHLSLFHDLIQSGDLVDRESMELFDTLHQLGYYGGTPNIFHGNARFTIRVPISLAGDRYVLSYHNNPGISLTWNITWYDRLKAILTPILVKHNLLMAFNNRFLPQGSNSLQVNAETSWGTTQDGRISPDCLILSMLCTIAPQIQWHRTPTMALVSTIAMLKTTGPNGGQIITRQPSGGEVLLYKGNARLSLYDGTVIQLQETGKTKDVASVRRDRTTILRYTYPSGATHFVCMMPNELPIDGLYPILPRNTSVDVTNADQLRYQTAAVRLVQPPENAQTSQQLFGTVSAWISGMMLQREKARVNQDALKETI